MLIPAVLTLALLALTLGLVLGACQVYLRDTASALELAGTAWFYGSPIIYPVSAALSTLGGGIASVLYMINPATPLLAAVRRCLIYPAGAEMSDGHLMLGVGLIAVACALILILGSKPFLRLSGNFADRL
jgi:ABC-type polysaccharide/polyol phosphate export permease